MKTHVKWLMAAVLAAACGAPGPTGGGDVQGGPSNGSPAVAPAGGSALVALQLGAANAQGFSSLLVAPDEVRVLVDGAPVQVRSTGQLVELTGPAQTVATFALPPGARRVEVQVGLGAAGSFANRTGSGWVDTRDGALRFETDASQLLRTRRSEVTIDAGRTFVERDGALVTVPTFRVR